MVVVTAPTSEDIAVRAARYLWHNGVQAGVIPQGDGYVIEVPKRKRKSALMYLNFWTEDKAQ